VSVVTQLEARRRAFPGYDDPRYPLYIWAGQAVVAGDASGGTRSAGIILAPASGPKVSLLWSLEQISALDTDNNSKDCDIILSGLDELLGNQIYRVTVGAAVTTAAFTAVSLTMLPLYMGGHADQGIAATLSLTLVNVDATVLVFQAQGYVWGSRSRSIPGGPQRPPNGLFPA